VEGSRGFLVEKTVHPFQRKRPLVYKPKKPEKDPGERSGSKRRERESIGQVKKPKKKKKKNKKKNLNPRFFLKNWAVQTGVGLQEE